MRKPWIAVVVVVGLMGLAFSRAQAASTTADATISVTPNPTIDIAIGDAGSYNFGSVDVGVGISTVSVSSLTLTNIGNVAVLIQKHIENNAGWTPSGTPGLDTFSLYVASAAAQPATAGFGANHLLKDGAGAKDDLKTIAGTSVHMESVTGQIGLWFKLAMPTAITAVGARNFVVRFTASAL